MKKRLYFVRALTRAFVLVLALALLLALALSLAGCGAKGESPSSEGSASEEPSLEGSREESQSSVEEVVMVGTWARAESPVVTEEMRAWFQAAVEKDSDIAFKPVALVATQLVSGMNYCFLSETMPKDASSGASSNASSGEEVSKYALVYLYVNLQSEASILRIETSKTETRMVNASGAWAEPETPELSEKLQETFAEAMANKQNASYDPIAVVSIDETAGINACIFCEKLGEAEPQYAFAFLYEDPAGVADVVDIKKFKIAEVKEQ